MITRFLAFVALAWALGFVAFMLLLPAPLDGHPTDAIVVPTGAAGRIDRGIDLIEAHEAKRLLITGVAPTVRPIDLALEYHAPPALFACCIDLGREAVDTRSNAEETAQWVRAHHYHSVRLVTSDWHMARARMELGAALDKDVVIVRDGVKGEPNLKLLLAEYNKLLLRRVALWLGIGG
ncbi:YdcF family protein [Hephaestia mangrovi]|uniref:YdcF family protein n=1 Tax=Hephaestia mangrovi TaxID=2873268 RepID=UPI001CA7657B|nr:YdcF family protein [Hephaestia mangrovi]